MKRFWLPAAMIVASMTGGALAQSNAPEPTRATNGPAGSVEAARAGIAVDSNGAATGMSETFKKSQSYTDGNGLLTARTHIETTGPVTTTITK
jgi:hypothetical protein